MVARKHNFDGKVVAKPTYIERKELVLYKIRDVGEVFTDTFQFFKKYFRVFGKALWVVIPLCVTYTIFRFMDYKYGGYMSDWYQNMGALFNLSRRGFSLEWLGALTFILSINITAVFFAFNRVDIEDKSARYGKAMLLFIVKNIWRVIPIVGVIFLLLAKAPVPLSILSIGVAPFIFILSFPGAFEKRYYFGGILRGFQIGGKSWGTAMGIFVILLFLSFLFFWFGLGWITLMTDEMVDWFIITETSGDTYHLIKNSIEGSMYLIFFNFIFVLFFISANILYFSTVEKEEARGMFNKLASFGKQSKVYETEDEGEF